jgi:hypothetical protein
MPQYICINVLSVYLVVGILNRTYGACDQVQLRHGTQEVYGLVRDLVTDCRHTSLPPKKRLQ